ncbi:large conductance mechanosensitive channel protein MscL [Ginsengibacter hankyongi]|uniref:Large-conductance mechanosensitive channel n=1 Tax=Ginsengibacter hankyongi TaxID=2607284 RepID=A0A5J5IIR5_9BACT|nr:large conductance mechanosensitive channel protein MscL [Ginsengibacter hankyongi]KAA9039503.1 large conductance mechanosensitive channel protein MscL [Ginsengibacter hankyongi]
MSFIKDFKAFAMKGNVMDLAVAVIIGAAFGAIVSSLVTDIITPLVLTPVLDKAGLKDIAELKWGAVTYGKFLAAVINFVVIAFVIFLLIKAIASMQKKEEAQPAGPSSTDKLLMEIRDELKNK